MWRSSKRYSNNPSFWANQNEFALGGGRLGKGPFLDPAESRDRNRDKRVLMASVEYLRQRRSLNTRTKQDRLRGRWLIVPGQQKLGDSQELAFRRPPRLPLAGGPFNDLLELANDPGNLFLQLHDLLSHDVQTRIARHFCLLALDAAENACKK